VSPLVEARAPWARLGPTKGWSSCSAYHASRDGSVIVAACSKAPDFLRGFRWTRAEGAVALGTLGESHYAWRVSGDGKVIAGNYDNGDEAGFFLWTDEDGMVPFRAFDDEDGNSMNDLSSDGSVVVGHSVTFGDADNATFRAFRWTKQGCTDLGRINPDDRRTEANGVNGDGTIIVGSNHLDTFRWTSETGLVVLPKAPYGADTMDAISADGPDSRSRQRRRLLLRPAVERLERRDPRRPRPERARRQRYRRHHGSGFRVRR
jgi:uncharacterized membrane protein